MAHKAIATTAGLDWTVIAELIRRGGLRREKNIAADQVDAHVSVCISQSIFFPGYKTLTKHSVLTSCKRVLLKTNRGPEF